MKRISIPEEIRKSRSEDWSAQMTDWVMSYRAHELSGAQLCARILNLVWSQSFGPNYQNGPSGTEILPERLRFLPLAINEILDRWHHKEIHLELKFYQPTPFEVLQVQSGGGRIVSLMIKKEQIEHFSEHGRDFASFLVHDLVHASHFFTSEDGEFARQVQFSQWMQALTAAGGFGQIEKYGSEVKAQFEYLISDMNTHTWHLIKTLKSHFDQHRMSDVQKRFLEIIPQALSEQWPLINTANEDREFILDFLSKMLREAPPEPLLQI